MSVEEDKVALREHMRAVRAGIQPFERDAAAAAVADALIAMLGSRRTVMAFLSFGSELPTDPIIGELHAAGHRIAVPHIVGEELVPLAYAPGDPVEEAVFGIREPADHRPVDPATIDVVLVPGLAFDLRGHRVGYGGGFYDRLLPVLRSDVRRVGVCLDVQVVDAVPAAEHDLPVDEILTEARHIRVEPPGSAD